MTVYKGPERKNKIGDGKIGVLMDSSGKKPFEYKDRGD